HLSTMRLSMETACLSQMQHDHTIRPSFICKYESRSKQVMWVQSRKRAAIFMRVLPIGQSRDTFRESIERSSSSWLFKLFLISASLFSYGS
ncbi:hypothetical protein PMAYCL1PPCAC_08711, partial [Pristionchus mayeri]